MISFITGLFHELELRILQMIETLKTTDHHPDIKHTFVEKTIELLNEIHLEVQQIIDSGDLEIDILANHNLYSYNQISESFQIIEVDRYQVIMNYGEPEVYFNKKVNRIYQETRNLANPPLITTISNSETYYWAHPVFEIIAVPTGEEKNLLNLPDIYHETGHLLNKQYPDIVNNQFEHTLEEYFQKNIDQSYDDKTHDHYIPFFK